MRRGDCSEQMRRRIITIRAAKKISTTVVEIMKLSSLLSFDLAFVVTASSDPPNHRPPVGRCFVESIGK